MLRLLFIIALVFSTSFPLLAECLKGNCFNGYGSYLYANGAKYVGDFLDGKPHGKGILYFANGNKYIGHWQENLRQGEGRMVYLEGHEYLGMFRHNLRSGFGVMKFANGDVFEGNWTNDRQNGWGKYTFRNGERYEGNFVDGRFEGEGTLFYGDGTRYEGQWMNSRRHGIGTLTYANGRVEKGNWINDAPEEAATESASRPEGFGEAYDRDCNSLYCNYGTGTYVYGDGSKYLGEFLAGKPEGHGTVFYSSGDKYVGKWKEHAPHGQGIMTYKTGKVLGAVWHFGRPIEALDPEDVEISGPPVHVDENRAVKIWAVVVGVGTYTHMPPLRFTDDDAYQIYAFLKSPAGGALPESQLRVLVDDDATRENVLSNMRELFLQADENDVILFYFSGHGLEGSFLPVDYDGFYNRLQHQEIRDILADSRAKHKMVIADACHSGSLLAMKQPLDSGLNQFYDAFEKSAGGLALLMSSKGEEFSLEDGGLRSGVFSHYLIMGLRGFADRDENGIVTITELFDYVHAKVRSYTANAQTPTLSGSYDQNMPIASTRK